MSDDYPKLINVNGQAITVASEEDEARWRGQPVAEAPAAPEPVAPTAEPAPEPVLDGDDSEFEPDDEDDDDEEPGEAPEKAKAAPKKKPKPKLGGKKK